MEINIYFLKEVTVSGQSHTVLRLSNMSSVAKLRYKKILNARMMYTEEGEIIIRINRKGKIVYLLLPTIDTAIRQQKHIIERHEKAGLPPRTTNSEHRLEVLLEEKSIMDKISKTAFKLINRIKEEVGKNCPDFEKIKNHIYFFGLGIDALWVKPYLMTARRINQITPDASLAASYKEPKNLMVNLEIIDKHLEPFKKLF